MKYFILAVVLVCWVWEAVALTTGRIPTITHMVHDRRDNAWMAVGVFAFTGWIYYHLLVEGR